jgi:hypothetical protein
MTNQDLGTSKVIRSDVNIFDRDRGSVVVVRGTDCIGVVVIAAVVDVVPLDPELLLQLAAKIPTNAKVPMTPTRPSLCISPPLSSRTLR